MNDYNTLQIVEAAIREALDVPTRPVKGVFTAKRALVKADGQPQPLRVLWECRDSKVRWEAYHCEVQSDGEPAILTNCEVFTGSFKAATRTQLSSEARPLTNGSPVYHAGGWLWEMDESGNHRIVDPQGLGGDWVPYAFIATSTCGNHIACSAYGNFHPTETVVGILPIPRTPHTAAELEKRR